MFMWIIWVLLSFSAFGIAYQDFKTRWISLWLIVVFAMLNSLQFFLQNSFLSFLQNSAFVISYFFICWLSIKGFYFVRSRSKEKIIDQGIGLGDIFLFLAIGCCLEPEIMIWFFTATFIIGLCYSLLKRNKVSVPLGGIVVIFYLITEAVLRTL